jgi:hypothetical protein
MAAVIVAAGTLGLAGCGSHDNTSPSFPYSAAPAYPTVGGELGKAQQEFFDKSRAIADRIIDDATNPNAKVVSEDRFSLSNDTAFLANHGTLINTRMPNILIQYKQGSGTIVVSSEDTYFPPDSAPVPGVFNGISLLFSPVNKDNELDTVLNRGDTLQLQNFKNIIDSGAVTLQNVRAQQYPQLPSYVVDSSGVTYTTAKYQNDPNSPPVAQTPVTPNDLAVVDAALENIQVQLNAGIPG